MGLDLISRAGWQELSKSFHSAWPLSVSSLSGGEELEMLLPVPAVTQLIRSFLLLRGLESRKSDGERGQLGRGFGGFMLSSGTVKHYTAHSQLSVFRHFYLMLVLSAAVV